MQELIVNGLLIVVTILAAILLLIGRNAKSGMTKNRRPCSGEFWQLLFCCWCFSFLRLTLLTG